MLRPRPNSHHPSRPFIETVAEKRTPLRHDELDQLTASSREALARPPSCAAWRMIDPIRTVSCFVDRNKTC